MKIYNLSIKGDSHYQTGLPCQDSSLTEFFDKGVILAVSDGHGSRTYVRSDVGSRLACQIAVELTKDFIEQKYNYLKSLGNVCYSPDSGKKQDAELQTLFSNIHDDWYAGIKKDAQANQFSPEERIKLGDNGLKNIKVAYGCTLIVAVITADFTFSFQIGDGRLFFITKTNNWTQPVPWDKDCEDNLTTSLCMESPIRRFRYSVNCNINGLFGIFGCSDGIEDCYGGSHDKDFESDELRIEYSKVIRKYLTRTDDSSFKEFCSDFLCFQSKYLSHDDMSIAFLICASDEEEQMWINLTKLESVKNKLKVTLSALMKEYKDLADRKVTVENNKEALEDAIEIQKQEISKKEGEKRDLEEKYQHKDEDIKYGSDFKEKFGESLTNLLKGINEYVDNVKSSLAKKFQKKIIESLSKLIEYITKEINEREQQREKLKDAIDKLTVEISRLNSGLENYIKQLLAQEYNLENIKKRKNDVEQKLNDFVKTHSSEVESYTNQIKELTTLLSTEKPSEEEISDNSLYVNSDASKATDYGNNIQADADNCNDSIEQILPTITIVKNKIKGENEDIQLILIDDQYDILLDNESKQTINGETGKLLCKLITDSEKYLIDSLQEGIAYITIQLNGEWPFEGDLWKDGAIYYISDPTRGQLIWDSFSSAIPHN